MKTCNKNGMRELRSKRIGESCTLNNNCVYPDCLSVSNSFAENVSPGIGGTTFKLTLNQKINYPILVNSKKKEVFEITPDPVLIYGKWYHKLLNRLTFGYKFNSGWKHYVQVISK